MIKWEIDMEDMFHHQKLGFAAILVIFSLVLVLPSLGADFSMSVVPNVTNTEGISYVVLNFTVDNTDDNKSIKEVVIYLVNTDFQFKPGNTSNGTSVTSPYDFTAITGNRELVWKNATNESIIDDGESYYFWFNTTVPSQSGNSIVTVKTIDIDDVENLINETITVDNDAPIITPHSPDDVNQSSANVTFNWSVTDFFDNVTCDLLIDGEVEVPDITVSTNGSHTQTVQDMESGGHNWSVTCEDGFSTSNSSETMDFGLFPELIVSDISWASDDAWLNASSDINVTVKIRNLGDFEINETYEKVINETTGENETTYHKFNVTLRFDGVYKGYLIINASFDADNETIIFDNLAIEDIGLGGHTLLVQIINQDETGTFYFNEANKTNNSASEEFYAGYLVDFLEINNITDSEINENETIEFVVQVSYSNGDPVPGLNETNFTFLDKHNDPAEAVGLDGFDGSQNTSGLYRFNVTTHGIVNGRTEPGNHTIEVTVKGINGTTGTVVYEGVNESLYELFAPDVVIEIDSWSPEIVKGISDEFILTLKNLGNKDAIDVDVKLFKAGGSGSLSWPTGPVNGNAGGTTLFCNDKDVAKGENVACLNGDSDNPKLKGSGLGAYILGVWVNYTLDSKDYHYYSSREITVINESGGTVDDDGGSAPALSERGGEGASCDSSSDCKSGYWCDNGACRKLAQNIDITDYPELIEIVSGERKSFEVEVKNTGVTVSLTKLTVSVDGIDVSVTPASRPLLQSETFKYMVTLTAGDTVDIGKYSGTLTALISTDESIKEEKSFEVRILPTEEKKAEIQALFANYSGMYEELKQEFEHFKSLGFVSEENLTTLQSIFDAIEKTINDAREALDSDDYVTAYISLKQFKNFHDQFKNELVNMESVQTQTMGDQFSSIWVWFIVGIAAIGVGGFLAYKFILVEGYQPGGGYKPKRNLLTQIKSNLNLGKTRISGVKTKVNMNVTSIKKPFSSEQAIPKNVKYSPGYEKSGGGGYAYSESKIAGSFQKVKNMFKRKKSDKYLSDYY